MSNGHTNLTANSARAEATAGALNGDPQRRYPSSKAGEPSVSIIINNYNYARFLRESIEGALTQTYPNTEVIVVDDGSTDESRAIIEEYASRVTPVLKDNGGQASALNAGFKVSRGDIIIFLDSDDSLAPQAAETVAREWKPGVAWIQNPLAMIDADGRKLASNVPIARLDGSEMARLLRRGFHFDRAPTSGCAFSRDVLERIMPMREGFRASADAYLCLLAPFLGETRIINESLGFYRVHSGNSWATTEFSVDKIRLGFVVAEQLFKELRNFAAERDLVIADDWLYATPSSVAGRLASLVVSPDDHPYPADRRLALMGRGVSAALRHPLLSGRKRLAYAAWFGMIAILPKPVARNMIVKARVATGIGARARKQTPMKRRRALVAVLSRRLRTQPLGRTLSEITNPRKVARQLGRLLNGEVQGLSNFYNLPSSREDEVRFCANLLGCRIESVEESFKELEGDSPLIQHLTSRYRRVRPDSPVMELGRFKIWFAVVRLTRPKVIVETGVHDGLSSALILSALSRNGSGMLVSIDLPSTDLPIGVDGPGWLVPQEFKARWKVYLGDARELLPKILREYSPVGVFIHDSDHRRPHQEFELRSAKEFLTDPGLLLCDDPDLDMWRDLGGEWGVPSFTIAPLTAGFRLSSRHPDAANRSGAVASADR